MSERIPTVPQENQERIATMPQGKEERIPTVPQGSSERISTIPQNNDNDRISTMPQQNSTNNVRNSKCIIKNNCEFVGESGKKFIIKANEIVNIDSGEAQIYGCYTSEDSTKYVAKIINTTVSEYSNDKKKTRKKVIDFLFNLSDEEKKHILPLIDYGTLNYNNIDYYVDIYPFCEEGDISSQKGEISYRELSNIIVPSINEALHIFHEAGFVHRDIKPDNIYKYKGNYVIGDFGITCDLRDDGFATDKYKTGTLGYYAPELMSQAAIKASDYYSFGQTIWTLYYGEMMYANILRIYKKDSQEEQRNQINYAMLNNTYYGLDEISEEESFFEILIRGLLQYDPSMRFDYDKVNRWLKNDKTLIREVKKNNTSDDFSRPFKYKNTECWNCDDIYNFFLDDWERTKDILYSGGLKEFFFTEDFDIYVKIDKILKEYSTTQSEDNDSELKTDIGVSKLFMLLNNGKTLVWMGREYKTLNDISIDCKKVFKDNDKKDYNQMLSLIKSKQIENWYVLLTEQHNNIDNNILDIFNDIFKFATCSGTFMKNISIWILHYLLSDEDILYRGSKSINDLSNMISSKKGKTCELILEILNDTEFYGFLFSNGYGKYAKYLLTELGKNEFNDVDKFFEFIISQIRDNEQYNNMLNTYINYGNYSYLNWWKKHLDIYEFLDSDALKLKEEIQNVSLVEDNIDNILEEFKKLDKLLLKFNLMFNNNIFLAFENLNNVDKSIISKRIEAYWHGNFLNKPVPFGFILYLEGGQIDA